MTRKRNKDNKNQPVSNGFTVKGGKKRHVRNQSPALVPIPYGLAYVLELVNLLPVQFRRPYWAVRDNEKLKESRFAMYQEEILRWKFGKESKAAKMAWLLGTQISDDTRTNTPSLLWFELQISLREMPIPLQAFVLRDEQGNEVEHNGKVMPFGVDPDSQSLHNLAVIRKEESELKKIIEDASKRIDKSIEDQLSGKRMSQIPDFDHPQGVLERVRQRLILVLGIQELVSYLIQPHRRDEMFFASTYYHSDAARSHFYVDKEGIVRFTPPPVVRLLEGVEAARIKECPICFKIFWAGRKDMRCCTTRCANTFRMRKFRQQYYVK